MLHAPHPSYASYLPLSRCRTQSMCYYHPSRSFVIVSRIAQTKIHRYTSILLELAVTEDKMPLHARMSVPSSPCPPLTCSRSLPKQ